MAQYPYMGRRNFFVLTKHKVFGLGDVNSDIFSARTVGECGFGEEAGGRTIKNFRKKIFIPHKRACSGVNHERFNRMNSVATTITAQVVVG
jgi:hypothetical protein